MLKKPSAILNLLPLWGFFVVIFYFLQNSNSFDPVNPMVSTVLMWLFFVFTVVVLVGTAGLLINLMPEFKRLKNKNLNGYWILGAFLFFILVYAVLRAIFYEGGFPLLYVGNVLIYCVAPLLFMFALWVLLYAIGKFCFKLGKISFENSFEDFLYGVGIGTIFVSLYAFLLLKLNIFYLYALVPLLIPAGLEWKSIKNLFWAVKNEWVIPFKKPRFIDWFLGLFILTFSVFNFIEAAAPAPSGHDDFYYYLNLPRLLADGHGFITGQAPHAFTFIQAIAELFAQTSQLSQITTMSFGLLALALIYIFIKKITSPNIALWITAIITSLPLVAMHSHLELKVEMPLFFFSILSLFSFYKWMQKPNIKWLVLAGLFAGFAFSIKISSIFLLCTLVFLFATYVWSWPGALFWGFLMYSVFIWQHDASFVNALNFSFYSEKWFQIGGVIILIAAFLIWLWQLKNTSKKQVGPSFLMLIILIISMATPFLPWAANNVSHNGMHGIYSILTDSSNPLIITSPDSEFNGNCEYTGGHEDDYNRYTHGNSPLATLLLLPWNVTIHSSALSPLLNIGFLFLIFVPFILLKLTKEKFEIDKEKGYWVLVIGLPFYCGLWALNASGVVWYGISGFILLILALAGVLYKLLLISKGWRQITVLFLVIWLIFGLFFRINFFVSRSTVLLPYMSGLITYNEYIDTRFDNYLTMAGILNENPNELIYLTNTNFLIFFIENNLNRVFKDQFLDSFYCVYKKGGGELFTEKLKERGVKYVVLGKPINDPSFSPVLLEANQTIFDYALTNYKLLVSSEFGTYLFEII